jgi:hypothetical protein
MSVQVDERGQGKFYFISMDLSALELRPDDYLVPTSEEKAE